MSALPIGIVAAIQERTARYAALARTDSQRARILGRPAEPVLPTLSLRLAEPVGAARHFLLVVQFTSSLFFRTFLEMKRQTAKTIFASRYVRHAPYGDEICTYCGDPAWVWDHVPALATMHKREWTGYPILEGRLVRSCSDCNSRLGDHPSESLSARREHIARSLRRRYYKKLHLIKWDADELEDLGRSLKGFIEAGLARRQSLEERLSWLRSPPRRPQ